MGANKLKGADRKSLRAPVLPDEIKGLLTRAENSQQAPFLIWDVSRHGLGLWSSEALRPGEKVKVTVAQPYLLIIDCEVKWCDKKPENNGYRCGLRSLKESKQLQSLYDKFRNSMEVEADQ